jgi:hypothetical protein
LARHFPSGEDVFLWGATEPRLTDLKKVAEDEFVVDFNNQQIPHVFRFAFLVDTGNDSRLQHSLGWDEGRRYTLEPRLYRYVYFLKSPRVPRERDKSFFLNAFGKSDKPHFFDGQKYLDDDAVTLAMRKVGADSLAAFLGLDDSGGGRGTSAIGNAGDGSHSAEPPPPTVPDELSSVVQAVHDLRAAGKTTERDHENVVVKFLEALGYRSGHEIRFQRSNIDILIVRGDTPLVVVEVKRDWGLTRGNREVVNQAFGCALDRGAPFVVVTNADYYAFFDRRRGLSREATFLGEFRLTDLREVDLDFIGSLRNGNLAP